MRRAFRLRYEVYCIENGFEDATQFPDRLEYDAYDARSVHILLRHRPSRTDVGTLRVIMPTPHATTLDLPMARVCEHPSLRSPHLFPVESTAELSRFAISKRMRRRSTDGRYPDEFAPETSGIDERRVLPMMAVGLLTAALRTFLTTGITHICAVMEPSLLRLLTRQGFLFLPLGPTVDYHGLRQPAYTTVRECLDHMRRYRPEIWDIVTDGGELDVGNADAPMSRVDLCDAAGLRIPPLI